ncbi:MAG: DUF1292 domain-containing protein [Clostridiales bacterium]|jgi:hypothetical protein|nr:DUF1292 domain-containing protein [Clostridiales bacterium]
MKDNDTDIFDLDDEYGEGDELEFLSITDEETGEEIELAVLDKLEYKGSMYYLTVEADEMEDEDTEQEASIFKEVPAGGDEFYYEPIEDDDEFDAVARLFRSSSGDSYDLGGV